jgi:polyisoprenoid-binding protein YceI
VIARNKKDLIMKQLTLIAVLALGAAGAQSGAADSKSAPEVPPASAAAVPAGAYTLDKAHSSLVMRLDHLGFSHFTARFTRFDADLTFDPANFAASSIKVNVDPHSLDSDNAPAGFMDQLRGEMWLDVAKYPQITYRSTKVEKVGAKGVRITGDLTLHGVTKPVVLNGTYNGGYAGHPMDPHARVGFSATGTFKRSDFAIAYGIPAPGTTMGVGDAVNMVIETEFSGPPLAATK